MIELRRIYGELTSEKRELAEQLGLVRIESIVEEMLRISKILQANGVILQNVKTRKMKNRKTGWNDFIRYKARRNRYECYNRRKSV